MVMFTALLGLTSAVAPPKISLALEGMAGAAKLATPIYREHDLYGKAVKSRQDWSEKCPAGSSTKDSCPFPKATAYDHQDKVVPVKSRIFLIDSENKPQMTEVQDVDFAKRSTYLFKYDASDAAGNHAEQIVFALILNDISAPKISMCGSKAVTVEAAGSWKLCSGSIAVDNVDGAITPSLKYTVKKVTGASSTVLCASCHYTSAAASISTKSLGEYLVALNVQDKAGIYGVNGANNKATTAFKAILVKDTTKPVITVTGSAVTQECATTYTDAGATCTDAQDGKIAVVTTSTVDTSKVGTYTVSYDASDSSKNAAVEKTRTVTVVDTTKPTIALYGAEHIVHYSQEAFKEPGVKLSDTCDTGVLPVSKSWNKAFNERKLGDYIRTYTVKDASGNTASTTRIYSVVDNKVPKVTVTGSDTMTFEASNTALYSDKGATCADHVDGNLDKAVEVSGDSVNMKVPGTYTIKYDCQDLSGNQAPQMTRTVVVHDTTAPVLTLTGASTVSRESGFKYTDAGATATDNLNGDITAKIVVTGTVNTNKPGTYKLTYNVADASGNKAVSVSRTVKVVDTLPPVITLSLKGADIHKSDYSAKGINGQANPAGSQ
jgi:hypothetical protein